MSLLDGGQEKEKPEFVFRPGNLVWGASYSKGKLLSIIQKGILLPKDAGEQSWNFNLNCICLALLSNQGPPYNYRTAIHSGPKNNTEVPLFKIGIILNRDKVLKNFPEQILAVGDFFHREREYVHTRYDFSVDKKTVFNIPISYSVWEMEPWNDEVRIYSTKHRGEQGKTPQLRPDLWDGIVLNKVDLDWIRKEGLSKELKINLPIFSPSCELIDIGF